MTNFGWPMDGLSMYELPC